MQKVIGMVFLTFFILTHADANAASENLMNLRDKVDLQNTAHKSNASGTKARRTPILLDFARYPNGKLIFMNAFEAEEYCKRLGAHLPTVRELAMYAKSRGAKGIIKKALVKKTCSTEKYSDCEKIEALNMDGSYDRFYYVNSGFRAPVGQLTTKGLWSSSRNVNEYGLDSVIGYELSLGDSAGDFIEANRHETENSVRCAPGAIRPLSENPRTTKPRLGEWWR